MSASTSASASIEDQVSDYLKTYGLSAEDIVDLVRVWAPLTVRIHGGCISQDRATQWYGVEGNYPFCQYRGSNVRNFGSGWGRGGVYERTDESGRKYWKIPIYTARHVIYDGVEAAKCS